MRFLTVTEKIERETTGLAGAIFVHVDHDGAGGIHGVRISCKWKDGAPFDRLANALGDSITGLLAELGAKG